MIAALHTPVSMGAHYFSEQYTISTNIIARMGAVTAGGWDEVCDNQRYAIDKMLGGECRIFVSELQVKLNLVQGILSSTTEVS